MRISMMGCTVVVALLAVSTMATGAESTNTSGAPDSKVMTQTQDTKAAGSKHGDSTKGGRPATQSTTPGSSTSRP